MLTVACCWWGWYPVEYVIRLKESASRNLTVPHRFVCMTDREAPCDTVPLATDLPDNMKLMALYRPDNGLEGRVLALDIDSLITGSLDDIAAYNGNFCTARDFYRPDMTDGFLRAFEAGKHAYLWEKASNRYRMEIPYFKDHMEKPDYWQDLYPGQVVSYKVHCKDGPPKGARIVSFHGKPKLHECGGWVKELWN